MQHWKSYSIEAIFTFCGADALFQSDSSKPRLDEGVCPAKRSIWELNKNFHPNELTQKQPYANDGDDDHNPQKRTENRASESPQTQRADGDARARGCG